MERQTSTWTPLQTTAGDVIEGLVSYLPFLFGSLVVLLIGWLIARLVRATSRQILMSLNRLLERLFQRGLLASIRVPMGASSIFGEVAFWVVIFMTLTIAARMAQLPIVSRWLNEIVLFLPSLFLGLATIVVGYIISLVVGEQVETSAAAAKSSHSALLGRLSKWTVLAVAAIIGLGQIGVNVTLFVTLAAVVIGSVLIGFSIAFGLGARDYVSNLIGARSSRQSISNGLLVRIGETQGEVLEITQTQVALDTENGRALVPARMVEEQGLVIIAKQSIDGDQSK